MSEPAKFDLLRTGSAMLLLDSGLLEAASEEKNEFFMVRFGKCELSAPASVLSSSKAQAQAHRAPAATAPLRTRPSTGPQGSGTRTTHS